jgi:quercetin dioxygenase-like cupin family protein
MSTLNRPLTGPMMTFDLHMQIEELRSDESYRRTGRLGRTLTKSGRLRLVLVALEESIEIGTHHAESPMTIQPVEGAIRYQVGGVEHTLKAGEVLFFGAGEAQDIRATERTALLLTLSAVDADATPERPGATSRGQG